MQDRRRFLTQWLGLAGAAISESVFSSSAPPSRRLMFDRKSLRVLILGGTGNIGPHYVRVAVDRGHQVTVFDKEHREVALPATVERLIGDRDTDSQSIRERDWDAVIDLAVSGPKWLRSIGETLRDRVRHYSFMSSVSTYGVPAPNNVTEEHSLVSYSGTQDPYTLTLSGEHYGSLKALCEIEARNQFGDKLLILRPGYIVCPEDSIGALSYWLIRMKYGSEIMVAGSPDSPVQFIDVRDLAEWTLRLVEANTTGVFNAVGPTRHLKFEQLLLACSRASGMTAQLTWVDTNWLAAQIDSEWWKNLLFWTTGLGGYAGTMNINIDRAIKNGLTSRPLEDTVNFILSTYDKQPPKQRIATNIPSRRDSAVSGEGNISWLLYLEREKELLTAWKAQS